MLGLTLALCSSLFGGSADFVGGLQTRRWPVLAVLLISQTAALVLAGAIVAVRGAGAPPGAHWIVYGALSGAAIVVALGALYRALAVGTMMIAAPIAATGAVVPVVVGIARGESPGALPLVGIVLALSGIALAARGEGGTPARGGRLLHGELALALLSAASFGCFFLFLDSAASADPLWAVLVTRVSFVALVAIAAVVARPRVPTGIGALAPIFVVGVLDLGAATLFAFATEHGLLSVVSVLASFPPLVTVVLARVLLHEHVIHRQLVGVALTLVGVPLMAA
jgi:drug/metabolite transporter (DMT)-like permease